MATSNLNKRKVGFKLNLSYTAKCFSCKWIGSKYQLVITMEGDFCPVCASEDTVSFGKEQIHPSTMPSFRDEVTKRFKATDSGGSGKFTQRESILIGIAVNVHQTGGYN